MRQKASLSIVVLILAIALFASSVHAVNHVTVDVGNYSVSNPKILVNYSDIVTLQSVILMPVDITSSDPYPICQIPNKGEYEKVFELYTKSNTNAGTCDGGEIKLLEPGKYSLTLQAINNDGNSTIDTVEFTIIGLDIEFVSPAHGIASKKPYDIKFWTSDKSVCKYSFVPNIPFKNMDFTAEGSSSTQYHRVNGLSYLSSDLFVVCNESNNRMTAKTMHIGYDDTPPVFQELAAVPPKIKNPNTPYSSITVKTDDKVVCSIQMCDKPDKVLFLDQNGNVEFPTKINFYNTTHSSIFYYNESPCYKQTDDLRPFTIYNNVTCTNLAGYNASKTITVLLNFSEYSYLNVLEPGNLINTSTFTVTVEPETFIATSCTLDGKAMTLVDGSNAFTIVKVVSLPSPKKVSIIPLSIVCENGVKSADRIYNVTIDTIPPPAPIIDGGDSVCSGYIPVKFSVPDGSSVKSYTYSVTDGGSFNVQNTTTQNTFELQLLGPSPSHLKWNVYATDDAGNQGPANETDVTLSEGDDETCGLPPFITFRSPHLGFAETAPYDLVLETTQPSECRYSIDKQTTWDLMSTNKFTQSEENMVHTKSRLTQESALMYVQCLEKDVDKMHYKKINIGVDSTAPKVSVKISPNTITEDPMAATVEVLTDDYTYCTHTSDAGPQFTSLMNDQQRAYTKAHYMILDYRTAPLEPQEHEFDVTCTNLVGMDTTVTALAAIDMSPAIDIEILSPAGFSASASDQLIVRTSQPAVCTWHKAGQALTKSFEDVNGNYTAPLGVLNEGSNFFAVWCEADGQTSVVAFSVTVDRSLPGLKNLAGPSAICVDKSAQYKYEVIGLDDNPVISYSLEGEDGMGVSFQANTSEKVLVVPISGILPGKYQLSAIPINHANARGAKISIPITILASTDEICTQADNHCTDKIKNPGEEGIDCGGTCATACISCIDKFGCPIDMICTDSVCVKQDSCSSQSDCLATQRCENSICVDASCTANSECESPLICIKGQCNALPSCATDDECAVPYTCVEKVCVLPICGNMKQDVEESATDCGGSCPECVSCATKNDCKAAQNCNAGFCASPSCNVTADCDENHVCQNKACIPVFVCTTDESCPAGTCMQGVCVAKTCSSFKDCNAGQDCENNYCVKGIKCTSDDTCTNGKSCVGGVCVNGCEKDIQCSDGRVCKNNACVSEEAPKPECNSYIQCNNKDEICVDQHCIAAPKSNLVSYLLIIFGLLIMGGAGYFLYTQDVEKKRIAADNARMQAARAPPKKVIIAPQMPGQYSAPQQQGRSQSPTGRTPMQSLNGVSDGVTSKPSTNNTLKELKENKRNSFFNAFDSGVEGKVTTIKDKDGKVQVAPGIADAASIKSSIEVPKDNSKDEEFIDLSDIKKKSSKKSSTKESDGKNTKNDDPFGDLDSIGKNK